MQIDVIYVTYNSEKWIQPCFLSWEKAPKRHSYHIFVVDNGSSDGTLLELKKVEQGAKNYFSSFSIISQKENHGFGVANNIAAACGKCDFILFLNIDTEIQNGMLEHLFQYISRSSPMIGMWELRQFPYEHPKYYDPVTLETTWSSGAAFAIRRKIFEKVKGFDSHFFMYAEDVDLSWKVRWAGYKIMYCPKALIKHNSYCRQGEIKPLQYGYSMRNNLLMRRKYGTKKDLCDGWVLFAKLLLKNGKGWSFNKNFLKIVSGYFDERKFFCPMKNNVQDVFFEGLDYSKMRYGAFQEIGSLIDKKVSIRTFILSADASDITMVKQCVMNETFPSARIDVVQNLSQVFDQLEICDEKKDLWISIICENKLVFADHNEFLISLICDRCKVVGSVDEKGEKVQNLSYYLFHYDFYALNRQYFVNNDSEFLASMCSDCCVLGKKQTIA